MSVVRTLQNLSHIAGAGAGRIFPSAPTPLVGEGRGGGCSSARRLLKATPLPIALRAIGLPHTGGGNGSAS